MNSPPWEAVAAGRHHVVDACSTDVRSVFYRSQERRCIAGKQPWDDGPEALTEIRNLLVHPAKKLRAPDVPADVLVDIGRLAIWYLELALMFLLGYTDLYTSRVEHWQTRPVPWTVTPKLPVQRIPHFPPLPDA